VRATRAQADRALYRQAIREVLEHTENVQIFQDAVEDIQITGNAVSGVITRSGIVFSARAVVLTAGTFLNGKCMWESLRLQVGAWEMRLLWAWQTVSGKFVRG
jgi:tRNA U34 5-carboxymethylaminomethyl modifying enzyme MnmG/GidA